MARRNHPIAASLHSTQNRIECDEYRFHTRIDINETVDRTTNSHAKNRTGNACDAVERQKRARQQSPKHKQPKT